MGHYNDICSRIYFEIPIGLRDYMISAKMEVDDYGVFFLGFTIVVFMESCNYDYVIFLVTDLI